MSIHGAPHEPRTPAAVCLTADGVPMYIGQALWDGTGQEYRVVELWSELVLDAGGNRRVEAECFVLPKGAECPIRPAWENLYARRPR